MSLWLYKRVPAEQKKKLVYRNIKVLITISGIQHLWVLFTNPVDISSAQAHKLALVLVSSHACMCIFIEKICKFYMLKGRCYCLVLTLFLTETILQPMN